MTKQVLDIKACDNIYLYKSFHAVLNDMLIYLKDRYGESAVKEYLRRFARSYYSPLTEDLKQGRLSSLKEHFDKVYGDEGAEYHLQYSDDELVLTVKECPGIRYLRDSGKSPSDMYIETLRAIHGEICKETPFEYELLSYDPETGASKERFYRAGSAGN